MADRAAVARALAFFQECDDVALLHRLVREIAPRARRAVGKILAKGDEDAIPPPADLRPAKGPASKDEALATLRTTDDFALLQVLARTIGQRLEAIEIAASADFPVGVRITVPEHAGYPRSGAPVTGTVEETGTQLQVLLDSGETWLGPPSLARLVTSGNDQLA